jgi:hypothetical protein
LNHLSNPSRLGRVKQRRGGVCFVRSYQFARHWGRLEPRLLMPDAARRSEEQECESDTDPRKDRDGEEG